MKLGEAIKLLRKKKKLTLDDVSRLSGVAKATLSRIENGVTSGNLKSHLKICDALQINLGELYQNIDEYAQESGQVSTYIGKNTPETAEVFQYDRDVIAVILTKGSTRKRMLPQLLTIEVGKGTPREELAAGTDKFIFCLEGNAETMIDKTSYKLDKNSSVYFDASLPHSLKNIGNEPARLIVVTSPVAL